MPGVLETAKSGRAKCRGCGQNLPKGELRFGELGENQFGDGETTYWFHILCAACKRPETFLEVVAHENPDLDNLETLTKLAEGGRDHHRLARISTCEKAKSGRAKCRHCKEAISKDTWRIVLNIWDEFRFEPMGFIHMSCSKDYFGTADIMFRVEQFTPDLNDEAKAEIQAALGSA